MSVETIAKSFGTALLYWLALYVVIVHLFVAWKWESYSVSPRTKIINQTKHETVIVIDDHSEEWKAIVKGSKSEMKNAEIDLQKIYSKQSLLQQSIDKMTLALQNLTEKKNSLEKIESELNTLTEDMIVFREGSQKPKTKYLEKLAAFQDLGEITRLSDLKRSFELVIKVFNSLIDKGDSLQWSAVNEVLSADYPERVANISACPPIPMDDDDDDKEGSAKNKTGLDIKNATQSNETALMAEDLIARQEEIREIWDEVYEENILPVTTKEIKRLEKVRQGLVDEWLKQVEESYFDAIDKLEKATEAARDAQSKEEEDDEKDNTDDEENDANCAKTDDVLAILEAGLDALHRQQTLREALRQAMGARDPSLKNVILDADLPLGDDRPEIRGTQTLRQYLDTEILAHDIPVWINSFFDWLGGRADFVDNFIDQLPENAGEVAVRKALAIAGALNLSKMEGNVEEGLTHLQDKIKGLVA